MGMYNPGFVSPSCNKAAYNLLNIKSSRIFSVLSVNIMMKKKPRNSKPLTIICFDYGSINRHMNLKKSDKKWF